jgi:hypothetical protein
MQQQGQGAGSKNLTRIPVLWHSGHLSICIDAMIKKLTISIDDRGNIGKSPEELAPPFVVTGSLGAAYAEMSADKTRDAEADEWCESLAADGTDAAW